MKVKELIEELQKVNDKDRHVYFETMSALFDIESVEVDQDKDVVLSDDFNSSKWK